MNYIRVSILCDPKDAVGIFAAKRKHFDRNLIAF